MAFWNGKRESLPVDYPTAEQVAELDATTKRYEDELREVLAEHEAITRTYSGVIVARQMATAADTGEVPVPIADQVRRLGWRRRVLESKLLPASRDAANRARHQRRKALQAAFNAEITPMRQAIAVDLVKLFDRVDELAEYVHQRRQELEAQVDAPEGQALREALNRVCELFDVEPRKFSPTGAAVMRETSERRWRLEAEWRRPNDERKERFRKSWSGQLEQRRTRQILAEMGEVAS